MAGYLLYRSGEYQGQMVLQHLRGGVWLFSALAIAAAWQMKFPEKTNGSLRPIYTLLLTAIVFLTLYTSHIGGSITHGPDFLTEHLPELVQRSTPVASKAPEELLVYEDMIRPVLEDKCLSCHNQYKTKGDLLMTSLAGLMKGGKSGKTMIVAGQPAASELYHRITLPLNDDERMPPPEKAPLDADEMALIHWWIASGASAEQTLGTGPSGPEGQALIQRYLPRLYRQARIKARQEQELQALTKELAQLGDKSGLVIGPDPESPGLFAVSLPVPPTVVTDKTVRKLLPYADVISKISLPGTAITDETLYECSKMPQLQYLLLPKTCITGEGLPHLSALKNLKTLNLAYTTLDNAGVLYLLQLPQLERIYLFGAKVEPNVLEALRKHLPKVKILEEEGPYM